MSTYARERLFTFVLTLIAFAGGLALGLTAPGEDDAPKSPVATCKYEDGSGSPLPCYWDADSHGNGTGADVMHFPDGTFKLVQDYDHEAAENAMDEWAQRGHK